MLLLFTSASNKQIGNFSQNQGCTHGPEAMACKKGTSWATQGQHRPSQQTSITGSFLRIGSFA